VARQLAQARAAADEARQARAKLDALTGQLQQARLDPSDLPAALRQLSEARAAAEDAVKSTETQLARLREQLNLATAEARTVEDRLKGQLAQMTTARQGLTAFVQEVARRLQAAQLVAPNPAATELLAGLDRALARRPGSAAEPNPAQAEQHYTKGYRAYRGGDYAEAEQRFAAAELANDRDARYPYFLGLARLAQGKSAAAVADFRRGAALEQQNLPNAAEVDRALEAVPRDARLAIGRYRP
jgi:TolA-binding protein